PLLLGIGLLLVTAYLMWRKPVDPPVSVLLLAGIALILLSDENIANLKFGTSGVEVTRKELTKAQASAGEQIGKLARDLEEQKQRVDALLKNAGPIAAAPAPPNPAFAENSRYSVLVFYRDRATEQAEAITADLVRAGFKSAKVNTDLTEVGRLLP